MNWFKKHLLPEKSHVSELPFKIKISFRKRYIYLLPQGWQVQDSLSNIRYQKDDTNIIKHYLIPSQYHFTWLFLDIHLTLRHYLQSEQKSVIKPAPKYDANLKYTDK